MPHGPTLKQLRTWKPACRSEWLLAKGWKAPTEIQRAHSSSLEWPTKPQMSVPEGTQGECILQRIYCSAHQQAQSQRWQLCYSQQSASLQVSTCRQAATLGGIVVHLQHLWRQPLKHLLPASCRCAVEGCPAATLEEAGPCNRGTSSCSTAKLQMCAAVRPA